MDIHVGFSDRSCLSLFRSATHFYDPPPSSNDLKFLFEPEKKILKIFYRMILRDTTSGYISLSSYLIKDEKPLLFYFVSERYIIIITTDTFKMTYNKTQPMITFLWACPWQNFLQFNQECKSIGKNPPPPKGRVFLRFFSKHKLSLCSSNDECDASFLFYRHVLCCLLLLLFCLFHSSRACLLFGVLLWPPAWIGITSTWCISKRRALFAQHIR